MNQTDIKKFTSWLGKRSYKARVENLGIERIREIARENGKKGGRPPKDKKEGVR
jgi:galactokinase/mevalonate kinase-like predicted kinase